MPEDFSDLSSLQNPTPGRFCASPNIPDLRPLCDENPGELNDRLDELEFELGLAGGGVAKFDVLAEQDTFDSMFAFVK